MIKETITSLQNPLVKAWRNLNRSRSERVKQGFFLAEGEHMAQEAVREYKAAALLMDTERQSQYAALLRDAQHLPVYLVSAHIMEALSDAKAPQGVIALCPYPESPSSDALGDKLVVLDGVQDPGNVGTILRTMDAAGYSALILDEKTADPYSPKALRSSMGGVFRVPACRVNDLPAFLEKIKRQGYEIIAGDLRGEPFYERRKSQRKKCVIIGNEGAGISPAVLEKATMRLKIPIVGGAESLNAAVAGAIMMYDLLREEITEK